MGLTWFIDLPMYWFIHFTHSMLPHQPLFHITANKVGTPNALRQLPSLQHPKKKRFPANKSMQRKGIHNYITRCIHLALYSPTHTHHPSAIPSIQSPDHYKRLHCHWSAPQSHHKQIQSRKEAILLRNSDTSMYTLYIRTIRLLKELHISHIVTIVNANCHHPVHGHHMILSYNTYRTKYYILL